MCQGSEMKEMKPKALTLTEERLLLAMREYASQKDLDSTPELYVDTLRMLMLSGLNYTFAEKEFLDLFSKVLRSRSSKFTVVNQSSVEARPTVFYVKGFEPKEKK
jgi:hypothetical protein